MNKSFSIGDGGLSFAVLCLGLIFLGLFYHNTFLLYLGIVFAVLAAIAVPIAVFILAPAGILLGAKAIKMAEKKTASFSLKRDLEAVAKKRTQRKRKGNEEDEAEEIVIDKKDWDRIWSEITDKKC